jgi:hypothetical protein
MRIRATAAAAVVSGALALTGAAIPAAQAAGTSSANGMQLAQQFRAAHPAATGTVKTFAAKPADGTDPEPYTLDVAFSNVKINSGKIGIPVGTTNIVHVPYSFTLTATNTDLTAADFYAGIDLYHGSADAPDNDLYSWNAPTCSTPVTTTSGTDTIETTNCTNTVDIHPADNEISIDEAGAEWHAMAWAIAFNGQDPTDPADPSQIGQYNAPANATTYEMQRYSKLTVNASPEPVSKGATVTIVGSLTRANWDTNKYAGYTSQPVKLQFRKAGTSTYTTLKTINTDSHGNLKTTYKASVDGYWRYSFAGTTTTPAVNATGDYVDVK